MSDGVNEVKEEEFWEKHLEKKKQIGKKSDNEDEYLREQYSDNDGATQKKHENVINHRSNTHNFLRLL